MRRCSAPALLLAFLLALCPLPAHAAEPAAPITLAPGIAEALQIPALEGFTPVFCSDGATPAYASGAPDFVFVIAQKGQQSTLCILQTQEDGRYTLALANAQILPPIAERPNIDVFPGVSIAIAYPNESIEIIHQPATGEWLVSTYYFMDAGGNSYSIRHDTYDLFCQIARADDTPGVSVHLPFSALETAFDRFDPQAAQAFLLAQYENRNGPRPVPASGSDYNLPEPQVVAFPKGKKYDVYTGPGKKYLRSGAEVGQQATVSTNDWIQVFGREGDYLLICYNLRDGRNRFGYIHASALPRGVTVPTLAFDDWTQIAGFTWLTDDPFRDQAEIAIVQEGSPLTVLCAYGEEWAYVEYNNGGKPCRGFIQTEAFDPY